ncbi:MAG TPA: Type 1 glutamine amidotransferase-like domain-containing protein [Ktedonobacteraceae bacterium]|nr:Type 1 glutamine amidotransferase-like domain-containing protein [Ktedonobacteraceae bacterium]
MTALPPPTGTIALIGSGEYLPPIQPLDRRLLEHIEGTPQVVVLPTAAAPDGHGVPERWTRMGVEHFTLLGAEVKPVMLLTREDAQNPELVRQITSANFVYFSGGKPRYLLETLQNTPAWEAIVQIYKSGGVIAGCSAGAMAMGEVLFDFPKLWNTLPALGLASGLAIIPHFDEIPRVMLATLPHPKQATIVGVDGSTALVGRQGHWTVYGSGSVTVFAGKQKQRYTEDQEVLLPTR